MPKKLWLGLALLSGLFLYQFFQFNVLQDDAFISFRYIRNFLDGHGLVFNIGERVEGYTNFLWIILLSLLSKLGLPLIETARVLGILAGIGTLALTAYAAHKLYPKRNWLWILSVPLLLAANGAFAYWAGSGLETGLFTLLATASAITYLTNMPLSLLLVTLATLTRPEGALLAFLFGIAGIVLKQKSWKATLTYWGALVLLMLPYAVFKWLYFGSLLPNPFYAKTGFDAEYWQSGLEYAELFFKHYGLYGAALLLPLIFWRKLDRFSRFCLVVFCGYAFYVISIGGDVLKAHRFFVPVLVFLYVPFSDFGHQLFESRGFSRPVFLATLLVCALWFYKIPLNYLKASAAWEKELVDKMSIAGRLLGEKQELKRMAISTIGAFSYHVGGGRKVIDLLGLTDTVIARHPENIKGMATTWKERNFNAQYVLSRKPDVILFSTGYKPSAPAERALFLYPDFRRNYRMELYFSKGNSGIYFHRFRDLAVPPGQDQSLAFVNLINQALNQINSRNYQEGVRLLNKALADGPDDCEVLYTLLGYFYFSTGDLERAEACFKKSIEINEGGTITRYYYRNLLSFQKRYAEAQNQDSIIVRTVPNFGEFLQMPGVAP